MMLARASGMPSLKMSIVIQAETEGADLFAMRWARSGWEEPAYQHWPIARASPLGVVETIAISPEWQGYRVEPNSPAKSLIEA